MRITLFGGRNLLGGGVHFANFAAAASKAAPLSPYAFECNISDIAEMNAAAARSRHDDINIYFGGFSKIKTQFIRGRNVVFAVFETTTLPRAYLSTLMLADAIWVMSGWGRQVLISNGVPPSQIDVVPEGVDPEMFRPQPSTQVHSGRAFRFLCIGKYEERKGYRQLFEAFKMSFHGDRGTELIVKADYFIDHERKHAALVAGLSHFGCENIRSVSGRMSTAELANLYRSADAFVFPSRSEGWGLPLIEALSSGLPAIAVNYSGQSEYLSAIPELFLAVKHKMVPIMDPEIRRFWPTDDGDLGLWAEADVNDLALKMKDMRNDISRWREKAATASHLLRAEFSWARAAEKAAAALCRRGWIDRGRT